MPKATNKKKPLVSILGGATFDMENNNVHFEPNESIVGEVQQFSGRAKVSILTDGTFEIIPEKRNGHTTKLIKKLAHGRLSVNKAGVYHLTLSFDSTEETMLAIGDAISHEGWEASSAIKEIKG